ncbi:MAG: sigma-70 family RNA polymerase sigma factor [Bacteroidota bacterium]|nr:sigma-70 family RNA polymerase sigma factor [Bacteroidota bacterium]MDP4257420.1 sigma-70 family RNA polymerase sigma factor [Bacteroidota bacterium]
MTSSTYNDIVSLVQQKDWKGFEMLYNTYGQKFFSFAVKRWFLTEDEAWEVVYQTLQTLVLKLPIHKFESKKHFENFLYKVFINYLRQHYRRHRKKQSEEVGFTISLQAAFAEDEPATNDDPGSAPELDTQAIREYYRDDVAESPNLVALKCALHQLKPDERDILLLRAQNYTYEEIAKMLNIKNNQLKVKHLRSKKKLIQLLNKKTANHG